jgi:Ca2+-binding RTX toxin-like protein
MLEILLPMLLVAGAVTAITGLESNADDEGREEDPSESDPNRTHELMPLIIDIEDLGSYVGGDQNDILYVEGESGTSKFYDWDHYVEQPTEPANEVRGGSGNDQLHLSGSGYRAFADEGADWISAGDASDIAIYAEENDTIIGGVGKNVYVRLEENAIFEGREGSDFVISSSTSSTSLGAGADKYFGISGSGLPDESEDLVYGGSGNDLLVGSIRESNLWHAHANDQDLVSFDSDILYGDSDDDTLVGSHGDHLYGGDGQDTFIIVLSPEKHQNAALVVDFEPGLDQLEIRLGLGELNSSSLTCHEGSSFLDLAQHVDANGDTVLLGKDGQELVRIVGVGGLTLGIDHGQIDADRKWVLDLDGNKIERETCDVVVRGQFTDGVLS